MLKYFYGRKCRTKVATLSLIQKRTWKVRFPVMGYFVKMSSISSAFWEGTCCGTLREEREKKHYERETWDKRSNDNDI